MLLPRAQIHLFHVHIALVSLLRFYFDGSRLFYPLFSPLRGLDLSSLNCPDPWHHYVLHSAASSCLPLRSAIILRRVLRGVFFCTGPAERPGPWRGPRAPTVKMKSTEPGPRLEQASLLKGRAEAQTTGAIRKRLTQSGTNRKKVGECIIFCLDVNARVVQMWSNCFIINK